MSGAVERGPNYNWEHEAQHYKEEANDLRKLLRLVERSGDQAFLELEALRSENEKLKKTLRYVSECKITNKCVDCQHAIGHGLEASTPDPEGQE